MSNRNSSGRKPIIVLSNRSKKRLVWIYVLLACVFEVAAFWIGFGYKSIYGVLIAIIGVGFFVIALSFYQTSKGSE